MQKGGVKFAAPVFHGGKVLRDQLRDAEEKARHEARCLIHELDSLVLGVVNVKFSLERLQH